MEGFARDGYVAVRGAFDAATAAACRQMIWAELRERGVRQDDPVTWPPLVHIDSLGGGLLDAAATSPALVAAYDQLIGPGRWTPQVYAGGAIVVRFPSQDRANAGYHIEGSYDGPGGYWVNIRSRTGGLLALLLLSDVGPDDAPTRQVCGSHLHVPEFLAPHVRRAPALMRSSGGHRCCAGRSRMRPAWPVMSCCAIRSWCTPRPGRTAVPRRG